MEAADRKNDWTRLEDEFWEVETRWKWLLTKTKWKMIASSLISKNQNKKEGVNDDSINKEYADKTENNGPAAARNVEEQREGHKEISDLMSKSLVDFCESVYDAIKLTTSTMSDVKLLMWYNWENEIICESFYDAIQFSQQLLENLSTTWTIVFSLFRAQNLELLYKAERLTTQATSGHQLSLKFVMSCWETYLAACQCWTEDVTQPRIRVKESIHAVGRSFAASLERSHSMMVAISKGLDTVSLADLACQNETNSHREGNRVGPFLRKDKMPPQVEMEARKPTIPLPPPPPSPPPAGKEVNNPNVLSDSEKKVGELLSEPKQKASSSNAEAAHSFPLKMRHLDKLCWPDGATAPKGEHYPMEIKLRILPDGIAFTRPLIPTGNNQFSPNPLKRPFLKQAEKEGKTSENALESGTDTSKCKCCCGSPGLDSESEATDDNEHFCSQSHCATLSDSPQPEFRAHEWEALIEDVKDLHSEWVMLSLDFSSFPEDALILDSMFKSLQVEIPSGKPSQEESTVEEKDQPLSKIFEELVSAMGIALQLSRLELERQAQTWQEKNERGQLKTHSKGFDPNEALSQAKSLLFQLTQTFFYMMLLTTANNRRRVLCYASLLPESLAKSRKFAYHLTLAREIPGKRNSTGNGSSCPLSRLYFEAETVKSAVVNPHPLCQYLSLALCKAHAFSSKFISSSITLQNAEPSHQTR